MEDYVAEALQQGIISKSTLPASAGVFLYKRKAAVSDHVLIIAGSML